MESVQCSKCNKFIIAICHDCDEPEYPLKEQLAEANEIIKFAMSSYVEGKTLRLCTIAKKYLKRHKLI